MICGVVVEAVVVVGAAAVVVGAAAVVVGAAVVAGVWVVVVGGVGTPAVERPRPLSAARCAVRVPCPYQPSAGIPRRS